MKSYFVFLGRNKLYAAVTVLGFALSLAFVILVALYARDEFTVDSFHKNIDRIYRVEYGNSTRSYNPPAMGPELQAAYAEVESYVRYCSMFAEVRTSFGEKIEIDCAIVDSSYFSVFSVPLIEGSPSSVMCAENDVLISERAARKLFGTIHGIVGRSIRIDRYDLDLTICGIYAEVGNSALPRPDLFVRLDMLAGESLNSYSNTILTLILLEREGTDLMAKAPDFTRFFRERGHRELRLKDVDTVTLRPFDEVYFSKVEQGLTKIGDLRFLIILIIAAAAILLFAVINYINLSVAQSGFRAREMATRRLMGSSAGAIFGKFIAESIVLCAISFVVAIAFASLVQGLFNDILQSSIDVNAELTPLKVGAALCFIGVLGLIAGVIPAFVITKFNPIEVVRGTFTYRAKKVYGKILITFQYAITVVLIGMATLIIRQTAYMQNLDLGFSTKNLYWAFNIIESNEQANVMRSRLMQINGVESVGFSQYSPLHYPMKYHGTIFGRLETFNFMSMDSTCFEMFGFRVKELSGNCSDAAVYINEKGLRRLGYDKVPDQIRTDDGNCYQIKGVVEDFHYTSLTDPIDIVLLADRADWALHVVVKTTNRDIAKELKTALDELTGGRPFKGNWLDDNVATWSDKVERQSGLILSLSILAIVISALGMLAMATYFIRQRRGEIAVRKVYGSSRSEVLSMLVWQFLKLVVIAYALAAPLIWYFGNEWLAEFPYKVQIGAVEYIVAAVVAFAVASLTILWQAYRAAVENPATAVKH